MFNWAKKGLLFEPSIPGYTHASHPCIIHLCNNTFILAFTCRDSQKRSHVFLSYAEVNNGNITITSEPKLALGIGGPGCFDCDGVITGCLVENSGKYYLYYVGWQVLPNDLWLCDTGRAILDPEKLELHKEFYGPVLGRDKDNPLFAAATAFYITDDNLWHAWYNSGIRWEKTDKGWHHWYGFHHATSSDGVDWKCEPDLIFPFADEYEYAFGRPSVVFWDGVYHMWFAHRGTKEIATYRIGYASSTDCVNWNRNDTISGIDVSSEGWDSEMICYPSVFEHKGYKYMLYNGNGYGISGFGFSVLDEG